MERIYFDHAAATPLDPRVLGEMEPFWAGDFANPSAIHKEGVAVRNAVEAARERIAEILHVGSDEIIFTGSATESINLALRGAVDAWKQDHPGVMPHLIVSAIEHDAVLETSRALEREGARVDRLPVNAEGSVDLLKLSKLITKETVVISVMYANNEIGTVQPIEQVARIIRKWKKDVRGVSRDERIADDDMYPLFHTDATQAVNYLPIHIPPLGVDMMTFNAAKIYGPKGVGALYRSRRTKLLPLIYGGSHEAGLRAGTENVPAIVGFGEAFALAYDMREKESRRLSEIRDQTFAALEYAFPEIIFNGSKDVRLPNNVNFSFPGVDHEFLALALDARGFSVATKSACNEVDADTSHVLLALNDAGRNGPLSAIRLSFGRGTKKGDIDLLVAALAEIMRDIIRPSFSTE